MKISQDIRYVGASRESEDLFEGLYKVPCGMAYNSYVICDEQPVVMDTIEQELGDEWLENVEKQLEGKAPAYLVVQHMEPDHSANVQRLLQRYPQTTVVANSKTFAMLSNFFPRLQCNKKEVADGERLCTGRHTLRFIFAPMVHWPEVMVTYDEKDEVLFSADAFGKFGSLCRNQPWEEEAARYYFGIVGKYGVQVQALLKKASALSIKAICPLHGPVLSDNLQKYLSLYDVWSRYGVEKQGVLVAYTSVYGHTRAAARLLADTLADMGVPVEVYDLARCDEYEAVSKAFRYGKIALATTTYNMQIFPAMRQFLSHLTDRNFQNRKVAVIENGSWAPCAAKLITQALEGCKNVEILPAVTLRSAMTEQNVGQIKQLAQLLAQ